LFEEGEDYVRVLRGGRIRERALGIHQAEMLLVPLVERLRIIRSDKRAPKAGD
jgi:hypothetical protein